MVRERNLEVKVLFNNRFVPDENSTKGHYELMVDHFSQKLSMNRDEVKNCYEQALTIFLNKKELNFPKLFSVVLLEYKDKILKCEKPVENNVLQEYYKKFLNKAERELSSYGKDQKDKQLTPPGPSFS